MQFLGVIVTSAEPPGNGQKPLEKRLCVLCFEEAVGSMLERDQKCPVESFFALLTDEIRFVGTVASRLSATWATI